MFHFCYTRAIILIVGYALAMPISLTTVNAADVGSADSLDTKGGNSSSGMSEVPKSFTFPKKENIPDAVDLPPPPKDAGGCDVYSGLAFRRPVEGGDDNVSGNSGAEPKGEDSRDVFVSGLCARAFSGDVEAQLYMASFYAYLKNASETFRWYKMAAKKDVPIALYEAGHRLVTANGVVRDMKQGMELLERASEKGLLQAQYMLGMTLTFSEYSETDYKKAYGWFEKAARESFPPAQFMMGYLMYDGLGVARDINAAFDWFLLAAHRNFPMAQFYLGVMYASGDGTAADKKKSYIWYTIAQKNGVEKAKQGIFLLEKEMKIEDIEFAKMQADSWKSTDDHPMQYNIAQ